MTATSNLDMRVIMYRGARVLCEVKYFYNIKSSESNPSRVHSSKRYSIKPKYQFLGLFIANFRHKNVNYHFLFLMAHRKSETCNVIFLRISDFHNVRNK